MATTYAPTAPERKKAGAEAEKAEETVSAAEEHAQLEMRNGVRRECEALLIGGALDADSAMVMRDATDWLNMGLTEKALEDGNLRTHEEKLQGLQQNIGWIHNFVREAAVFGHDFLDQVKRAKKKAWNGESMARWKAKLKQRQGGEHWPDARERLRAYLRDNLKEMADGWDALESDLADVEALRASLGASAKDVPALAALSSPSFAAAKFPARRKAVTAALAGLRALRAERAERDALRDEAATLFAEAVGAGLLPASKAARAMKSIFAPGNSMATVRRYVRVTLPAYKEDWATAAAEYDAQAVRAGTLPIKLLPKASFLALPYAAREAYLRRTDARLDGAEKERSEAGAVKEHLQRAIDAEDWDEARALLKAAKGKFPAEPAWKEFQAVVDASPEREADLGEPDPKAVLARMRDRVAALPPAVQALYAGALEEDGKMPDAEANHFRAVTALMQNGAVLEERGMPQAEEETDDVAPAPEPEPAGVADPEPLPEPEPEPTPQPEPVMEPAAIAAPASGPAVTDAPVPAPVETPEPPARAEVVRMDADPASQQAVLAEVAQGRADETFLQRKALVIDVPPETRQELNGTVNAELARDARYLRDKGLPFTLAA